MLEQLDAETQSALLESIPVKKFCTPEEVAHVVNFLVSPLAGFITGEIIDQVRAAAALRTLPAAARSC
eukprot:SAG22_NODE_191_length_15699_cov_19.660192_2_plen_68_part_00